MTTTADEGYYYTIRGGVNYSDHRDHPVEVATDANDRADAWDTLEHALDAWIERYRPSNTYFPMWGDGIVFFSPGDPEMQDTIIYFGNEAEIMDGFTLEEALQQCDRLDEFAEFHGMTQYVVNVAPMRFWADDEDHAVEQYLNAAKLAPAEGVDVDELDIAVTEV